MRKTTVLIMFSLVFSLFLNSLIASAQFSISTDNPHNSWFEYSMVAGSSQTFKVVAKNISEVAGDFIVYPVDAKIDGGGGFLPESFSAERLVVGKWVTLKKSEVQLDGNKNETIEGKIVVPLETPAGKYAGAIMIEEVKGKKDGGGAMVSVGVRVGVRVYITVKEGSAPNIEVFNSQPEMPAVVGVEPKSVGIVEESKTIKFEDKNVEQDLAKNTFYDEYDNDFFRLGFGLLNLFLSLIIIFLLIKYFKKKKKHHRKR